MKGFVRALLGVYTSIIGIVSLVSFAVFINEGSFNHCFEALTGVIPAYPAIYYIALGIALVFFILSLVLFVISIKTGRIKKAVGRRTSIGEIKITLVSIENIVMNAVKRQPGVKEARAAVSAYEDNVSVSIRMVVFPDVNLPMLSEEIQSKVKKGIEDNAGIVVNDVRVIIDNIYTGPAYKAKQME